MTEFIEQIQQIAKENPVLAGLFGVWFLSVGTFILKSVPQRIFNYLKGQCYTTIVVNSQDVMYFSILNWVAKNKLHNLVREFQFSNGRYGDDVPIMTVGYTPVYFFIEGRLMWISRNKEQSNDMYSKETMKVSAVGRNRSVFTSLFKEIQKYELKNKEEDMITITSKNSNFTNVVEIKKRPIDSVIIDKSTKHDIVNHIGSFLNKEDFYKNSGLPYRTGLLLYGPPGTGKTSFVHTLASHFGMDISVVSLSSPGLTDSGLINYLSEVKKRSIILLEDIDCINSVRDRDNKSDEKQTITFSGIANALDGIISPYGCVVIMTTNHRDKLDPAIIRDGRCNLKYELGYMTREMVEEYLDRFFKDVKIDKVREKLTAATLQKLVIKYSKLEDVLGEIC